MSGEELYPLIVDMTASPETMKASVVEDTVVSQGTLMGLDYRVLGADLQVLELSLKREQSVVTRPGAMMAMGESVVMETRAQG